MSEILVVATIKVNDGEADTAIAGLTPIIEKVHEQEGCLSYALHRDINDPNTLVFVERWESQDALNQHVQQPHMAELGALAASIAAEPPQIVFCESLGIGDSAKGTIRG
ncbi:MAG: antibiotic biosynthesis monooxygenase [Actinobacteria bacterium]|uniref:Unannotated protein n=1 Tax=freshwater metagenome TaxID=449393 RepID=A0A6J5ZA26_9ZZZZ|nr:antibiotic biosynthesis monooxygenase [Actinomycetota bacterium]